MKTELVKIAEIAEINPRIPTELANQPDHEVNFVPMSHLSENGHVQSNGTRRLGEVLKGYTYFESGDVLVAKITPCMENGKAAFVSGLPHPVSFGSTEFHVLRPGPKVHGRYLFYMVWNSRFRHAAERNMTGTAGQKRVPKSFLERYQIPLPPLSEQKRIADILDKADAIRRRRQEAAKCRRVLLQSAFLDICGFPQRNPKDWPTSGLADITSINRGKFTPRPRNDPRYYGGEYPFIQTGELAGCDGVLRTWRQTLNEDGIRVSRSFPPGTVCIAIVGATIGETAILGFESYCPDSVIGIQPIPGKSESEYIEYLLRFYKQPFRDAAPETARANINLQTLTSLQVPVPPLEVQHRFAEIYRRLDQSSASAEKHASEVNGLFNSLVQRAFRGEL